MATKELVMISWLTIILALFAIPYLYGRMEHRREDMARIQRALEVLARKDPENGAIPEGS